MGVPPPRIDLIIVFLLREKIDLKTSISTPMPLPSPTWAEATFSWFVTGLRKVHNYGQEVTSACRLITVKRIRYQNLPDWPRLIENVLYSVNLSLMTHLASLISLFIQGTGTPFMRLHLMPERYPRARDFSHSYVNSPTNLIRRVYYACIGLQWSNIFWCWVYIPRNTCYLLISEWLGGLSRWI